jgi:hypothetical protein
MENVQSTTNSAEKVEVLNTFLTLLHLDDCPPLMCPKFNPFRVKESEANLSNMKILFMIPLLFQVGNSKTTN